jgi:glycosyltransferase involved in cell wall biosynthesis
MYRRLRSSLRRILKPGKPLPEVSPYPGHYSVVRSVVEGLGAIGADFNHDPRSFLDLARVVYAPANEALRQAALLRRKHRIDFLVAGPANALFPDEADNVLRIPEIDLLIVPSEWVRELYRSVAPELVAKTRICPAGVDTDYWKPSGANRGSRVVVYWKSGDETFCAEVERILETCGLEPVRVRYGHYAREQYRSLLDEAMMGVFISSFETQGLALAEAWSMDVPTVVWDPQSEASWRGRSFIGGSSAPYLTPATGVTWVAVPEVAALVRDIAARRDQLRPRQWVLAHLTDAICSAQLLQIVQSASASAKGSVAGSHSFLDGPRL